MSQEDFAAHCEVHRVHMGKIERGIVGPSICVLGRIAAGLGISLSALVEEVEQRRGQATRK